MSWHYLQGQEVESSEDIYWDGKRFVPSKSQTTLGEYYLPDKEMVSSLDSQSGTTSLHLMVARGVDELMLSVEDFRAKDIVLRHGVVIAPQICGLKCLELSETCGQGLFSAKTSSKIRSMKRKRILPILDTPRYAAGLMLHNWAQITLDEDGGALATPTATANWDSPSMQKWASCRRMVRLFGKKTPISHEWLMGWPIGWTDLRPLEMDKFQQWLGSHGTSSEYKQKKRTAHL